MITCSNSTPDPELGHTPLRADARLVLAVAHELNMTPQELIRACADDDRPGGPAASVIRMRKKLLVFALATAAVILVSLVPLAYHSFSPLVSLSTSPVSALAQQAHIPPDDATYAWLEQALTDPRDPYGLRSIEASLTRQDPGEALVELAVQVARLRARTHASPDDASAEALMQRLLLVYTDPTVEEELRVLSLTLVARLFLEDEVNTPEELARTRPIREALESLLAIETDEQAYLYTVAALACAGTTETAQLLSDHLTQVEPSSERERFLTVALERIYRRALLCPDLAPAQSPLPELHATLQRAAMRDPGVADLLALVAQFSNDRTKLSDALAARYHDQDWYDTESYLAVLDLAGEPSWTTGLTQPDAVQPPPGEIASWHFFDADRRHRGTAGSARGQYVKTLPTHAQPQLRLNHFGRSVAVFPFSLESVPPEGLVVSLHQLAAQRSNLPYLGTVRFTLKLDGVPIAQEYELTRPGTGVRDHIRVGPARLRTGEHELSLELSAFSTTTYWLLDVEILEADGQ